MNVARITNACLSLNKKISPKVTKSTLSVSVECLQV